MWPDHLSCHHRDGCAQSLLKKTESNDFAIWTVEFPSARIPPINDLLYHSLNKSGTPAIKKPTGLIRLDGKTADGQTLVPWSNGRVLIRDVTVVDTVATSYVPVTAIDAGGVAERKHTKNLEFQTRYTFVPVAVETLGPFSKEGLVFISKIGRRLSKAPGGNRKTKFLLQSILVTVQRYNAVAYQGTLSGLPSAECCPKISQGGSLKMRHQCTG